MPDRHTSPAAHGDEVLRSAQDDTGLTDEQRERLQARLKELDAAGLAIMKARKPYDDALTAIHAVRYSVLTEAGVEELDEICETCERILFVGDLGHRCADGPVLCQDCAPTWNDLKVALAQGDTDADEFAHDSLDRESVEAHIAAGDGDKKHVWPLS